MMMRLVSRRFPASLVLVLCLILALVLVGVAYAAEVGRWITSVGGHTTSVVRPRLSAPGPTSPSRVTRGAVVPVSATVPVLLVTPGVTARPLAPDEIVLPLVVKGYRAPNPRVGFCGSAGSIDQYPGIDQLGAGWYYHYGVDQFPARPAGIEFVQTVRLHQMTQCLPLRARDRSPNGEDCAQGQPCPYVMPYTYTVSPDRQALLAAARANPGSVWFIGNEPDRRDWGRWCAWGPNNVRPPSPPDRGSGQDEMLPEVYAVAYHELYYLLKGADPTARVAIGGIIQATPARLDYLSKIWDSYRATFGEDMPVDVWTTHNMIFTEDCGDYGADVPPGYTGVTLTQGAQPWYDTAYNDPCQGTLYFVIDGVYVGWESHDNLGIFQAQIRAFREWMLAHGQKEKPLYISEYGIVYPMIMEPEDADHPGARERNQARATNYMLATFDYMLSAKDPRLGYSADDNRLVQRWAWFSLSPYDTDYTYLYNSQTKQLTAIGQAFALWARTH